MSGDWLHSICFIVVTSDISEQITLCLPLSLSTGVGNTGKHQNKTTGTQHWTPTGAHI